MEEEEGEEMKDEVELEVKGGWKGSLFDVSLSRGNGRRARRQPPSPSHHDYSKGFLSVLSQLTSVGDVTRAAREGRFRSMQSRPSQYFICVVDNVVVDESMRGKKLGVRLNRVLVELAREVDGRASECSRSLLSRRKKLDRLAVAMGRVATKNEDIRQIQAKDKVDLAAFALLSPSNIKLADKKDVIAPSSLSVYYSTVRADDKLMALVEFVRSVPDKKVLVFFSSCQCVQYLSAILPHFLTKRKIFAVHGKNKKGRFAQMAKFRAPGPSVMLSTDLMARGIDIADLDWVVHFDIPKKSSWLVHRAGRAGRNGREGASLLLTPGQAAYANDIKTHEKIDMTERRIKTITELKTEQAREKIVEMASKDRELLEHGTAAYISWLKAQTTHDAYIVCKIKELDLIGHAHAFGLLRLPKTKKTLDRKDVERFKRSDVDTSVIPNPTLEAKQKEEKGKDDGQTRRAAYKAKEAADPRAQVREQIKQKRDRSKAAGEQKIKDERRAKKEDVVIGRKDVPDPSAENYPAAANREEVSWATSNRLGAEGERLRKNGIVVLRDGTAIKPEDINDDPDLKRLPVGISLSNHFLTINID